MRGLRWRIMRRVKHRHVPMFPKDMDDGIVVCRKCGLPGGRIVSFTGEPDEIPGMIAARIMGDIEGIRDERCRQGAHCDNHEDGLCCWCGAKVNG